MLSIKEGHIDITKLLIEKGANVNEKGNEGETPLMFAAAFNNTEITRLLLEIGVDIDARDKNGNSALDIVKNADILRLLKIYSGESDVLLDLTLENNIDLIKAAINNGADPNVRSKDGHTPLIIAVQEGHTNLIDFFLKKSVDLNAKTKNGWSALMTLLKK